MESNMSKNVRFLLVGLVFCLLQTKDKDFKLHPSLVEKLLYFKQDTFKVFYGGPVDRDGAGVRWLMPIAFEDDLYKTRAVYEVAFINCDLSNAEGAEILFIEVSDINIKLKNILTPDYLLFSALLSGNYKDDKYLVVRFADVANVYYPDVFVFSEYGIKKESDKLAIVAFLHEQFKTSTIYRDFYTGQSVDLSIF